MWSIPANWLAGHYVPLCVEPLPQAIPRPIIVVPIPSVPVESPKSRSGWGISSTSGSDDSGWSEPESDLVFRYQARQFSEIPKVPVY